MAIGILMILPKLNKKGYNIRIYVLKTKERLSIRKKFTTTIDEEVIRQLKLQAVLEQTDANKIIERLIQEYLIKQQEEKQQ